MDIIKESLGLISISYPWTWGSLGAIAILTLPLTLFCLDHITQIISDLILRLNEILIRRLPKFIREPLQARMILMIKKSTTFMDGIVLKIRS